ncbi:hypothetical protein GYA25_02560 [Candidatus Woesearchaeota archaeon]|nr:hypothetical protein [Candidatus Woesearchaeota archaeon]
MKEKLTQLCENYNIPIKKIDPEKMTFYGTQKYNEQILINYLIELDNLLKSNLISIGGFSAGSKILGFRSMRRISNDLDCITNEEGIKLLNEHFHDNLFQTLDYGDLFLEYKKVPVSFDIEETHGWKIPKDFFEDIRRFSFLNGGLNSISPEYLIGLKTRRSINKKRFYGKDALDTINVLLSPFYRSELKEIDYEKIGKIIREHASNKREEIEAYLSFIGSYSNHIKKKEIPLFEKSLNNLKHHTIKNIF